MKDRNWFTRLLFGLGLLALPLFIYAFMKPQAWTVVVIITAVTVLYDFLPIRLPDGGFYSLSTIGTIYLLHHHDLYAAFIPLFVSCLTYFLVNSKPFYRIKWYRFLCTLGMCLFSLLLAYAVGEMIEAPSSFAHIFLLVLVYEGCNFILHHLISKLTLGERSLFSKPSWDNVLAFVMPVVICVLVVVELSIHLTFYSWLWALAFTSVCVVSIFYLTSAYSKQVISLKETSQRFQSLYDNNPDIVLTADAQGRITASNMILELNLGYKREVLLGQSIYSLVEPSLRNITETRYKEALEKGLPVKGEVKIIHLNGSIREFMLTCVPTIVDNTIVGNYLIAKDITIEKEAERMTERIAYYDSITGLPNRVLLMNELHQEIRRSEETNQGIGVLFLDFDQFKAVNDTFGHSTGDMLLVNAALRIQGVIPSTCLVARLGGDEFIIIQPGGNKETCGDTAQRIIDSFQKPLLLGEQDIVVTPSIGISFFPEDGYSAEKLISQADAAMYRVKHEGGGNYSFYTPELEQEQEKSKLLAVHLRNCLMNNELHLQYQPQYDLHTGRITGAEALLRWTSPVLGHVSPAEFIPLAEKSRLILPIGKWILQTVCKQVKAWQESGNEPIKVAVNISSIQLQEEDFLDQVKEALHEADLDPYWLELELTESVLIRNTDRNVEILKDLRELGVSLSIDDFGTGYSSLSYLNRFAIDYLKIDRSFIKNIGSGGRDEAIIRSIITLAKELRMKVVAEGIEGDEQFQFVQAAGCDMIQGYYISKPLLKEDFAQKVWGNPNIM